MNVLVIAPHPDDESIGCGGTLRLHTRRGDRVVVAYLTSGELGLKGVPRETVWEKRENEARKAGKILGLAKPFFLRFGDWYLGEQIDPAAAALAPLLHKEKPELIYVPHPLEWHPDHRAASTILWKAAQQCGLKQFTVRGYEIWTPLAQADHLENIEKVILTKLRAVRAHRSQVAQLPYDRAIHGLNQYRGAMTGRCRFAEVFQILEAPPS